MSRGIGAIKDALHNPICWMFACVLAVLFNIYVATSARLSNQLAAAILLTLAAGFATRTTLDFYLTSLRTNAKPGMHWFFFVRLLGFVSLALDGALKIILFAGRQETLYSTVVQPVTATLTAISLIGVGLVTAKTYEHQSYREFAVYLMVAVTATVGLYGILSMFLANFFN